MGDETGLPAAATSILDFWFETLERRQWFEKNDAVDAEIANRFLTDYEAAVSSDYDSLKPWCETPRSALAAVILLDQFTRNLFRGNGRSFESDAVARDIANRSIDRGDDWAVSAVERCFFYLPLEHSEDLADQQRCCALMPRTGDAEFLKYAEAHMAIIERFGRFPHRNAVLDRPSTPEEIAFLEEPGSSF